MSDVSIARRDDASFSAASQMLHERLRGLLRRPRRRAAARFFRRRVRRPPPPPPARRRRGRVRHDAVRVRGLHHREPFLGLPPRVLRADSRFRLANERRGRAQPARSAPVRERIVPSLLSSTSPRDVVGVSAVTVEAAAFVGFGVDGDASSPRPRRRPNPTLVPTSSAASLTLAPTSLKKLAMPTSPGEVNALAVVAPPPTPSVRRGVRTLLPARRYCALSFARSSLPIASKNAGSMSAKFAGSADIGSCDGVTGASADVDASSISPASFARDVRPAGLGVDAAARPRGRFIARVTALGVWRRSRKSCRRARACEGAATSRQERSVLFERNNVRLSCTATTRTGLASFSFNQTRSTRPRGSVRLTSTSPLLPRPPSSPPRAPQRPARPTPPSYPSRRASATSRRTDPGRRRRRRRKTRARRRGAARRRSSVSPGRRT